MKLLLLWMTLFVSVSFFLYVDGRSCFKTCGQTECSCSEKACDSAADKNAIGGYGLDTCDDSDSCVLIEFIGLDEKLKKQLVSTPAGCSSTFDISTAFVGFESFPVWDTTNASTVTNYTCGSDFCNLPSLESCGKEDLEGNGKNCVLDTKGKPGVLEETLLRNLARDEDAITLSGRASKSCVQAKFTGGNADIRCDVCEERNTCDSDGVLLVDEIPSTGGNVAEDGRSPGLELPGIIATVGALIFAVLLGIGCWTMGSRRSRNILEREQKKKDASIKEALEITSERPKSLIAVPILGAGLDVEEAPEIDFDYRAEKEIRLDFNEDHVNATVVEEMCSY